MVKKTLLIFLTLTLTFTDLFAQTPKGKIVNREVLLILKYVGKYEIKPERAKPKKVKIKADSALSKGYNEVDGAFNAKNVMNQLISRERELADSRPLMKVSQGGSAFDNLIAMLFPYVKNITNNENLPINAYLADLHNVPFIYLYNEIFVTSDLGDSMYREFCRSHRLDYYARKKNEPEFEPRLFLIDNPILFTPGDGGIVQASIINAEWEEFEIEATSDFHFDMGHKTLVFDKKKIFILKKIISIKPIDTLRNGEEKEYVQLIKSFESIRTKF